MILHDACLPSISSYLVVQAWFHQHTSKDHYKWSPFKSSLLDTRISAIRTLFLSISSNPMQNDGITEVWYKGWTKLQILSVDCHCDGTGGEKSPVHIVQSVTCCLEHWKHWNIRISHANSAEVKHKSVSIAAHSALRMLCGKQPSYLQLALLSVMTNVPFLIILSWMSNHYALMQVNHVYPLRKRTIQAPIFKSFHLIPILCVAV